MAFWTRKTACFISIGVGACRTGAEVDLISRVVAIGDGYTGSARLISARWTFVVSSETAEVA